MYQKILAMLLLIFLLSPSFTMSGEGNVPVVQKIDSEKVNCISSSDETAVPEKTVFESKDILNDTQNIDLSPRSEKHIKFVKMFEEMLSDKKQIPSNNVSDRIIYGLDDDLTKLYYFQQFLDKGNYSLKAELLFLSPIFEIINDAKFPLNYTDMYGKNHIIYKEDILSQIKSISMSNFPYVKNLACGALVYLGSYDSKTINDLEYFASGKEISTWDIKYSLEWTSYILKNKANPENSDDLTTSFYSDIVTVEKTRNSIRHNAIVFLNRVNDKVYYEEITSFFKQLIPESEGVVQNTLKELLRQRTLKKKDGSYNLLKNDGLSKSSNSYTEIWNGNKAGEYCLDWWETYNLAYEPMGNDCANFASQCMISGGYSFDDILTGYTSHPCGRTTIINCDSLNVVLEHIRQDIMTFIIDFTTQPQEIQENPQAQIPSWFKVGDIALLGDLADNWEHTIINHGGTGPDARFGCHTDPAKDKLLNKDTWIYYFDGVNYGAFDYITFYHVIGSTVMKYPDKDSLTVQLGDSLTLQAIVTNNTEPTSLNPITNFKYILKKKPENTLETLYDTSNPPSAIDSTYVFSFNTATQDTGRYILYAKTTYTEGITQDSCILKLKPTPTIIEPFEDDIYVVPSGGKAIVTDTIEVKVRVPQVLGSYPAINIKIDDVYVNEGEIVFDSEENLWIYYWDLAGVTSEITGKRFKIEAELLDDPNCNATSGAMLVEGLICEDFEDFTFGAWTKWGGEVPANSNDPWFIGTCPTNSNEKSMSSTTGYTTFSNYSLLTPNVIIPDSSLNKTKLEFDVYWRYSGTYFSEMIMDICNASGTPIVADISIPSIKNSWWHYSYDLSGFSGQTISIKLQNYHFWDPYHVIFTRFDVDNFMVYAIPDIEKPVIDFITGNSAPVNQDMIINIEFNDESDIASCEADYEIEGDSDTIVLSPAKDSYTYTGTICAKDHECIGDIVFRIEDSVGNEIISEQYSISWIEPGGTVLTAPQNVAITAQTDSTFALTWDMVSGASGYKVYSSLDPYGVFSEDTTGTFTESRKWEKLFDGNKYFYYIIATDAAKEKVIEIIRPREFR